MKTTNNETVLPLVTIAIPSYQHKKYIRDCIESIIKQDYSNIELIIIDDGSTDGSVDLIQKYEAKCISRFIRYKFITQQNRGLSATLQEAVCWSSGKYFMGIASDDLLLENKTSLLVEYLEGNDNIAGVFGGAILINGNGEQTGIDKPIPGYYCFDDIFSRKKGYIITVGQLLRTDLLKELGGYRCDIYIEDFYMWLLLTSNGFLLKVVPNIVAKRRFHESNTSGNVLKMHNGRLKILELYKHNKHYKLSVARVNLSTAIEFSFNSKRKAFHYTIDAMCASLKICLDFNFYLTLLRIIAPNLFMVNIKKIKMRCLQKSKKCMLL